MVFCFVFFFLEQNSYQSRNVHLVLTWFLEKLLARLASTSFSVGVLASNTLFEMQNEDTVYKNSLKEIKLRSCLLH